MSNNNYVIITDTTCDLPAEHLRRIKVDAIPLKFTINGKTYMDGYGENTLPINEFYALQRTGARGVTSMVSVEEYIENFTPLLEKGDVLYLAFSSALSGSYGAACVAAEELRPRYPERKLYVIDTKAASRGEGLIVSYAAQKRDEGMPIDELKAWVEDNWFTFCHLVTVDDLHHLRMGGRISAASEFIGAMLDIKPMIYMNIEGKLIPDGKVRGRKRALNKLVSQTKEDIINPEEQTLYICHGDCLEDAEYVRERLIEEVGVKDVVIWYAGTVIGSHTGPGVVAVFFTGKRKQ